MQLLEHPHLEENFRLKKLEMILIVNLLEEMLIQELKNLMMVYMMQ